MSLRTFFLEGPINKTNFYVLFPWHQAEKSRESASSRQLGYQKESQNESIKTSAFFLDECFLLSWIRQG